MDPTPPTPPCPVEPTAGPPPPAPAPPERRKWLRRTLASCGAVALLVALLPTLLSTGPGRRWALQRVNARIQGRIEIDDWSVGWWSGVRIDGLRLIDPEGEPALSVDRVDATDVRLSTLFRRHLRLGRIRASAFVARSRVMADGRNNLAAALSPRSEPSAPAPQPEVSPERLEPAEPTEPAEPEFDLEFRLFLEDGGELVARPRFHPDQLIRIRLNRAEVSVISLTEPAQFELTLSAPRNQFEGVVELKGSARFHRPGDPESLVPELSGHIRRLDLTVLSDAAESFGFPYGFSGSLNSQFALRAGAGAEGTEVRVSRLEIFDHADPRRRLSIEECLLHWQRRFHAINLKLTDPEGRPAAECALVSGAEVDIASIATRKPKLGTLDFQGLAIRSRLLADGRNNLAAALAPARKPQPPSAVNVAPPPSAVNVAQPPSAVIAVPGPSGGALDVSLKLRIRDGLLTALGPGESAPVRWERVTFDASIVSLNRPMEYSLRADAVSAVGKPAGGIDLSGEPVLRRAGVFNLDGLLGGHRGYVRKLDLKSATALVRSLGIDFTMRGEADAEILLRPGSGTEVTGTVHIEGRELSCKLDGQRLWSEPKAEITAAFTADPPIGRSDIEWAVYHAEGFPLPLKFRNTTLAEMVASITKFARLL